MTRSEVFEFWEAEEGVKTYKVMPYRVSRSRRKEDRLVKVYGVQRNTVFKT